MKNLLFGLLTLTTFGTLITPAFADQVIMQESSNYIYQEGTGNSGQQTTRQIHRMQKKGSSETTTPNYGAVQTSVQEGMQVGDDQDFKQTTIQKNEIRRGVRNRN
ncbi:hypothetical protein PCC8801_2291 [Rippkaea orientalis PCC 8801]|uniref:Uncharacterized protein n=1 Tax=Rippkaea orientalis (strain PCC 8801 / RF-1) TaxID=41431 RepID=B7K1B5_RIPO1|nr:hypothetical protein [Rippkaea orientalis]ACK66310.1 hypothetical protein PCC8801_2291 [Rippkaea orientalis PCC 8801]